MTGAIGQAGVWDEAEGVSRIAAVALAPDWLELFRFEGVDYADRPLTADILEAVRALGLIPREPGEGVHPHARPEPSGRAMAPWELALYLRGVRSSSRAIYERNGDEDAGRVWRMADRYHRFFGSLVKHRGPAEAGPLGVRTTRPLAGEARWHEHRVDDVDDAVRRATSARTTVEPPFRLSLPALIESAIGSPSTA